MAFGSWEESSGGFGGSAPSEESSTAFGGSAPSEESSTAFGGSAPSEESSTAFAPPFPPHPLAAAQGTCANPSRPPQSPATVAPAPPQKTHLVPSARTASCSR